MQLKQIVIATRNAGKVEEIRALFNDIQIPFIALADDDASEVEETGSTFAENAEIKAVEYARQLGSWCLADDSGLEIAALGGRPGVLSARYGGAETGFPEKMKLLLDELKAIDGTERDARFVCVMVLADEAGNVRSSAEGECRGRIALAPRGNGGFGYDPVFIPSGFDQTFGELSPRLKNTISHRTRAAEKILRYLLGLTGTQT